MIFATTSLV